MFKAMILLARREDATPEAFRSWLLDRHAPLAATLPGLRRLTYNIVEGDEAPYDGVAELWFDSRADFDAAYATEIGSAVAADSMANVRSRTRLLVDERPITG
ncbi:MAG TPA: EthD family reductase [Candidatus Limnocylindrales bacterium]|nr:EthD family reductase [Candidatus Limnocylindrales bacterium]